MKHRIFASALLLIGPLSVIAQKNRIEAGIGGYKFANVTMQQPDFINAFHVGYARSIDDKLSVFARYTRAPIGMRILAEVNRDFTAASEGKLMTHNAFGYFDLGAGYRLYQNGKHSITVSGGLSLAYGENTYLTKAPWIDPMLEEPYAIKQAEHENKMEAYLGAVAGLRYDYAFWANRINIGPEVAARYFSNGFPFQVNYGAHIGYNF